jgi:glycosyl transferase, family 25
VVFEDDLIFSNDARYLMGNDGWIPQNVDIVKIETISRKVLLFPSFSQVIPGRRLGHLASAYMGGGGYIASKSIATRLYDAT